MTTKKIMRLRLRGGQGREETLEIDRIEREEPFGYHVRGMDGKSGYFGADKYESVMFETRWSEDSPEIST